MLLRRLLAGLAIGGALLGAPLWCTAQTKPDVRGIAVEGTEFVVTLADGRVLRSKDLVGAVVDVRFEGQKAKLRITGVEPDPTEPSGTVWLHTVEAPQTDGNWSNFCTAGPDGRQQGFPLRDAAGGLEFTCTSGAIGKCVRFGYRQWTNAPDGTPLAPLHAACVRMLRGDYGGQGQPFTNNGMKIDLYDPLGIQTVDNLAGQAFEAGWTPAGAVCVHHARVKANVTLAHLEAQFSNLRGRTGAICTEDFARQHGAILFNRSTD